MSPTIRYAQSDQDVIHIHQFLVIVAGPTLPGPVDLRESATEVWRVANYEAALMAMDGDRLVGTMGLIKVKPWWNTKVEYLANRWAFTLPGTGAWRPLLKEAKALAVANDMELHLISEERGTVTILNKSKDRRHFSPPQIALPAPAGEVADVLRQ